MLTPKKGFQLIHQVKELDTVDFVQSGSFKDDTGSNKAYKASVKFTTTSIDQVENEVYGLKDKSVTIEYKIPCNDDAEVKVINNWLRTTDFKANPLQFFASIPVMVEKGSYRSTTDLHGVAFMNAYTKKSK